jgi:hypothetical protein
MKSHLAPLTFLFFVVCCLLPAKLAAKGEGVGFWMEGTVSEVKAAGDQIHFILKGKFWFVQYDGALSPQRIEVDCKHGISATVHQNDPFFAFSTDWGAGAIQEAGGLLRILKAAVAPGRTIKFELLEPKITFDSKQNITLTDAAVIRATDADL